MHASDDILHHEMATSIAAVLEAKEVGAQLQGYCLVKPPVLCVY